MNIKSLFLGPQAENLDLYEDMILEIVRDTGYLRRNFHPEDQPIITENDRLSTSYRETRAHLRQEMTTILAELKKGVPTYHQRHIGHMFGDLLIPAITGYFSTILYNPNNVVGEVSPATTRMELEFIDQICSMFGYKPVAKSSQSTGSWGHLCSGGTSANIEALWLARNLKYFAVSVKLISENIDPLKFIKDVAINSPDGSKVSLMDITFNDIFKISPKESYRLHHAVIDSIIANKNVESSQAKKLFSEAFREYGVQNIGVAGVHAICSGLQFPFVYISKTAHYSWTKAMDIIGLGKGQLIEIEVDHGFRMDMKDLNEKLETELPILAVIPILGTTEEGAIDPINQVMLLRKKMENKKNHSFFIHVDAAYGGYFAALVKCGGEQSQSLRQYFSQLITDDEINFNINQEEVDAILSGIDVTDERWLENIQALKDADSITIDPHKLGYISYPAGCIVYNNDKAKMLLAQEAPYLASPDNARIENEFLGQWTLEGSRPGAAATACYLSAKILPLNQDGYGKIMAYNLITTHRFLQSIEKVNKDPLINKGFRIVTLYNQDTNIVCYILSYPGVIRHPKWLNVFSNGIYADMSVNRERPIPDYKYIISKSDWDYPKYKKNIDRILNEAGLNMGNEPQFNIDKLVYLRSVLMNPLAPGLAEDYYLPFWAQMIESAEKNISEIMLQIVKDKFNNKRIPILWIENDRNVETIKRVIEFDNIIGKYLDITFVTSFENMKRFLDTTMIFIVDLNLLSPDHKDISNRKSGYEVLRAIPKKESVIVYSGYLKEGCAYAELVSTELSDAEFMEGSAVHPDNQIGKSDSIRNDIRIIIQRIFSIAQKR